MAEKPKPWRINFLLDLSNRGWKKISHVILNKFPRNCKDIEYRIMIDTFVADTSKHRSWVRWPKFFGWNCPEILNNLKNFKLGKLEKSMSKLKHLAICRVVRFAHG